MNSLCVLTLVILRASVVLPKEENKTHKRNSLCVLTLVILRASVVLPKEVYSEWGQCDASTGSQSRTVNRPCRVDGGWSDWVQTGECKHNLCSDTQGRRRESRWCNKPFPKNNGSACAGRRSRQNNCTREPSCPVDGTWCDWGNWTVCPTSCRHIDETSSMARRSRNCSCPEPQNEGECLDADDSRSHQLYQEQTRECGQEICRLVPRPGQTLGPTIDWDNPQSSTESGTTLGPTIDWDAVDLGFN